MLTALFANSATATIPGDNSPFMPMILFAGIFAIFYFLVIRPQNQKIKDQQTKHLEMINGLEKGDAIVTVGGVYGVVEEVIDDVAVEVEIASGVVIKILKDKIGLKVEEEQKKVSAPKAKAIRSPSKKDKGA